MKIVLASDSYKGCLSSLEVGKAGERAVRECLPDCETVILPVADGGEGTVEALIDALGGRMKQALVSDPLGRKITASYGIAGRLAVIECAACCGLTLLTPEERNPLITTTRGLGEMILDATGQGCDSFIIGLGGSATNDGGRGLTEVPGILAKTRGMSFTVACDVDTPFVGPQGASRVFGPQKGASPQDVELLERRLIELSDKILEDTSVDVKDMSGAGAAGGLGGAFKAYFGAELKPGVDMVLDVLHFEEKISGADLVITGEGCSDYQTVKGKTASGVLRRASSMGIPVALVSGAVRDEHLLHTAGFKYIERATPEGMPLDEAMKAEMASYNIGEAVKRIINSL